MASAKSSPADERAIAQRLLAAHADGERSAEIEQLEGEVLGLYQARVEAFVAHLLPGPARTPSEEVSQGAMEKSCKALREPATLRSVAEESGSFGPIVFRIARNEYIDFKRGRPRYRDESRMGVGLNENFDDGVFDSGSPSASGRPSTTLSWLDGVGNEIEALETRSAQEDVSLILDGVGGIQSFDGVLLVLKYGLELSFAEIERLLEIAPSDDSNAEARAAAALGSKRPFVARILTLIRNCEGATTRNANALNARAHWLRGNVRDRIDPDDLATFHAE